MASQRGRACVLLALRHGGDAQASFAFVQIMWQEDIRIHDEIRIYIRDARTVLLYINIK